MGKLSAGVNDLATVHPELISEWDFEKNKLKPNEVTYGSEKKAYWKCLKTGYGYEMRIADKSKRNNCPICSNKLIIQGYNDLGTTNPELLPEWHPLKNGDLSPHLVTAGSNKKVWWKCNKGHEWEAPIYRRASGSKCPICQNQKIIPGYNSLKANNPVLSLDWHPTKNFPLTPDTISPKSGKRVWWKCHMCGNEWEESVSNRAKDCGCPFCSGHRAIPGQTDLQTVDPDLFAEFDLARNNIDPKTICANSGIKVWWKCKNGHSWMATPNSRHFFHSGCPMCDMERKTSFPEQAIYYYVKQVFPDTQSRYHAKWLGKRELDIYNPTYRFAIEYDGCAYHQSPERDMIKIGIAEQEGIDYYLIREIGCPILHNVTLDIIQVEPRSNESLQLAIKNLLHILLEKYTGLGIKDIDIDRDRVYIYEQMNLQEKGNSLATSFPLLAKEWNKSKNGNLTPQMVTYGSNKKVWWICPKCAHEWQASIVNRTKGRGCPICARKKAWSNRRQSLLNSKPTEHSKEDAD